MHHNPRKRSHSTRANLMVAVGSALYFLILLLALYVMDRQVYSNAKMEIVRENFIEIFQLPDTINDEARRALYTTSDVRREADREQLRDTIETIVNGPTSMYHMRLVDEDGETVMAVSNPEKPLTMNTWDNNLFIRDFSGRTSQNVSPLRVSADTTSTQFGYLTGTYTSPEDVPEITALTHQYRLYAGMLFIAWVLTWLVIYYYLLRPVRNVTLNLDRSRDGAPSLIRDAHGALEHGYNDLAASALIQLIEEKLNAAARPGHPGQVAERHVAIQEALTLAAEGFGASHIRVGILQSADAGAAATETHEWKDPAVAVEQPLPPLVCPVNQENVQVVLYDDASGFTYHAPLAAGCMQTDFRYRNNRLRRPEFQEYFVRTCDALRAGFVAFQAYREQLFRERSEANISLSRNMGHDLTNIIATSKLDLMGIKRILENVAPGTALNEQRAVILGQSVSGLLESTRFMQEMVNIYRSFSYVKRPAYERRQLAPLIDEFVKMFEPALSTHVTIHRDLEPEMPAPIVEPRLLKLALFNVLQNAIDAMKRATDLDPGAGVITVGARYFPEDARFEIVVRDNGPGIRDGAGRMMDAAETQSIFDYGYSTKGDTGEGLGLNWVKTIMTEFHDGGVRAENLAGGGAAITLWLRSMERKEARVGNQNS